MTDTTLFNINKKSVSNKQVDAEWSGERNELATGLTSLDLAPEMIQSVLERHDSYVESFDETGTPEPTPTPVICHTKVYTGQCVDERTGKMVTFRCHVVECSDGFSDERCQGGVQCM